MKLHVLVVGAAALASSAHGQTAAQKLLFPMPEYALAFNTASGGIADLDGDGRADLAGQSTASGNLGLTSLRGLGDGTFGLAYAAVPTSQSIEGLWSMDLDGDGWLDLVHDVPGSAELRVSYATGAGTYFAPAGYPTHTSVEQVAAGDVDLDGDLDLVASTAPNGQPSTGYASVLLGDGQGGFVPHSPVALGPQPGGVALRDLDGDGRADLLAVGGFFGQALVFFGLGSGNFVAAGGYSLGLQEPSGLACADFDGDGDDDLAATGFFEGACALLGTGRGTFGAPSAIAGGERMRGVLHALDIDGDLDLDLAALGTGCVMASAAGLGNGAFGPAVAHGDSHSVVSLAAGDLNGDARPDFALSGLFVSDLVVVLNAGGALVAPLAAGAATASGGPANGFVELRDLDADGHLDLASGANARLVVALGDGTGSFAALAPTPAIGALLAAAADFDGNGLIDCAMAGTSQVQPLLQQPGGAFQAQSVVGAGGGLLRGAAADLTGDGAADLALPAPGSQWLDLLQGDGSGGFQPLAPVGLGKSFACAVAVDLDNDGDLDVAAGENLGFTGIFLFTNAGSGALGAPVLLPETLVTQIVPLDYDADGDIDLAASSTRPRVRLGDGLGGFGTGISITPDAVKVALAFGDYDADGRLDLVGGTAFSARSWLGTGGLVLGPAALHECGGAPVAGDVDEDGRLDVALPGELTQAFVLLNQTHAPQLASIEGLAAAGAGSVVLSGVGLEPTTQVEIDGVPVTSQWLAEGQLAVDLAPHAPGHFDVQLSGTFGSATAAGALARWPALSAGSAALGAPLAVTLENGGPGLCVVAAAGTLLGAPLALPGIHHVLELAAPVVLSAGSVPPSGIRSQSFLVPNDPQLAGATLYLQAWASQPGQGSSPESSFANLALVVVP